MIIDQAYKHWGPNIAKPDPEYDPSDVQNWMEDVKSLSKLVGLRHL